MKKPLDRNRKRKTSIGANSDIVRCIKRLSLDSPPYESDLELVSGKLRNEQPEVLDEQGAKMRRQRDQCSARRPGTVDYSVGFVGAGTMHRPGT
jgi:hypothetical protein